MARLFREVGRRLHIVAHEDHKPHLHKQDVDPTHQIHHIHHRHGHHHHHHHHHHNHLHISRSDTEDADHPSTVGIDQPQNQHQEEYANIAQECWEAMWDYLSCPDSEWKHETGKSVIEGIIHSKHDKEYGKIYRLQGEVDMDAKSLWEEMVHNINKAPSWNPTLIECNTVAVLDENTDISHNVANDAVGGLIASRDFVNLRHWGIREGIYISAGQGVTHPDCPPSKKRVRGFNGPGGWAFRPVPGEPNRCVFIWIMNTNLKGWIPQRVIDQASSAVLLDYLKHLRRHVAHLQHRV